MSKLIVINQSLKRKPCSREATEDGRDTPGCAKNFEFPVGQVAAGFVATTTIMPFSVSC